jgi:hypothetical protein
LPHRLQIVDAQDLRAALGGEQACRNRSAQPLLGGRCVDRGD